jgi:hypothetical protein
MSSISGYRLADKAERERTTAKRARGRAMRHFFALVAFLVLMWAAFALVWWALDLPCCVPGVMQ